MHSPRMVRRLGWLGCVLVVCLLTGNYLLVALHMTAQRETRVQHPRALVKPHTAVYDLAAVWWLNRRICPTKAVCCAEMRHANISRQQLELEIAGLTRGLTRQRRVYW